MAAQALGAVELGLYVVEFAGRGLSRFGLLQKSGLADSSSSSAWRALS